MNKICSQERVDMHLFMICKSGKNPYDISSSVALNTRIFTPGYLSHEQLLVSVVKKFNVAFITTICADRVLILSSR